jgi:hypothetical protein
MKALGELGNLLANVGHDASKITDPNIPEL